MAQAPTFIRINKTEHAAIIDVSVDDSAWDNALTDINTHVQQAVSAVISVLEEPQPGELSVALVSDANIHELNKRYRGKDKPTNVLSFPGDDHNPCMGDIVIAYGVTMRETAQKGVSIDDHTSHLLIHGYLHLLGYDHESDAEASAMEAIEIKALASLGINNPYESDENV